jgi:hypothetical protein
VQERRGAIALNAAAATFGVLLSALEAYLLFSRHHQDVRSPRVFLARFGQPLLSLVVLGGVTAEAAKIVYIVSLGDAPQHSQYSQHGDCLKLSS